MRFLVLIGSLVLGAVAAFAEGIPVENEMVRNACGTCHQADSSNRMSRISYVRKPPEAWEETVKRMVRLHGLQLSPSDAHQIVQYLGDRHGLTASEYKQIAYVLEHDERQEVFPNQNVRNACATCHTYAKIASQRRTREEWLNLKDFLLAVFPTIVYQHRFEDWMGLTDQVLPWLADQFPLESPEWQKEKNQTPPADGRWFVVGHLDGKGDYFGSMTFHTTSDGSRETEIARQFQDGSVDRMHGSGQWFGAAAWRGTSEGTMIPKAREVFHRSPDGNVIQGRWFPFDHPELGAHESRHLEEKTPRVLTVMPVAVRRGATGLMVQLFGESLPTALKAGDINLGEGITVEKVEKATAEQAALRISVTSAAKIGWRDVAAGPAHGQGLLAVYDKPDYLRVMPSKAMARTGGTLAVKKMTQFEAHAFSNGPDGIPGNADDIDLGMVQAKWKISEAYTTYADKDASFVGSIDQNGLFTPALEGPNPARPRSTNNVGDVWVDASYIPEGATTALESRAYLLVSVPLYRELNVP